MMKKKVLLGYEVGTGRPVEIPMHHLVVTGTTQLSGKTTTLEALIVRSNMKAIAFRTKRGEGAFAIPQMHFHQPYFRERADWQYVESLLEATMREKMKFERSWIIRTSKGARTLRDVLANVNRELETARGLSESVYTNLKAYLEIVVPQVESAAFVRELTLRPGVNVMDLVGLSDEVQTVVVGATLEALYEQETDCIVVIPEVWKFVPEGRGSPVKRVLDKVVRQGAAIGILVWLDSQDLAGVDKKPLKSVDDWLLGRQREINEVEHTIDQVPLPKKAKPKPEDVMMLGIGHFIVCYGDEVRRVYVRPAWLPEEVAIRIAKGDPVGLADPYRPVGGRQEDVGMDLQEVERRIKEALEAKEKEFEERERRIREGAVAGSRDGADALRREFEERARTTQEAHDRELAALQKDRLREQSPSLTRTLPKVQEVRVPAPHQVADAPPRQPIPSIPIFNEARIREIAREEARKVGLTGVVESAPPRVILQGFLREAMDRFMDKVKALSKDQKRCLAYLLAKRSSGEASASSTTVKTTELQMAVWGFSNGDTAKAVKGLTETGLVEWNANNRYFRYTGPEYVRQAFASYNLGEDDVARLLHAIEVEFAMGEFR